MSHSMLNLDDDNVELAEISVTVARSMIDGDIPEEIINALDNAQGYITARPNAQAFLVIKIKK